MPGQFILLIQMVYSATASWSMMIFVVFEIQLPPPQVPPIGGGVIVIRYESALGTVAHSRDMRLSWTSTTDTLDGGGGVSRDIKRNYIYCME